MINIVTIFGYACLFGVIGMIIGSVITCDILNNKQLRADMGVAAVDMLKEENQKLEKAIDKACSILASSDTEVYVLDEENNGADGTTPVLIKISKTRKQWKEWCLKDE